MRQRLDGKVAIVTGGSRGIGRAIAERLGAEGAAVVIGYVDNVAAAEAAVSAVEAAGGRAVAVQALLDGPAPVRALFATAVERFGAVDILVLNAAAARFGPLESVTEEEFDQTVAVNVKATFFAFQEAAAQMADNGRIIAISAALTRVGYPNTSLYAATKGAVEQMAFSAAKELGKRGILVNVVSPGATSTDLYDSLASPAAQEAAKSRSPMGRLAEPDDIAGVVAFLASDDARWVSGQNISVSGAALW